RRTSCFFMQVSWTYLWQALLTMRSSQTVTLWQTLRDSSVQTGTGLVTQTVTSLQTGTRSVRQVSYVSVRHSMRLTIRLVVTFSRTQTVQVTVRYAGAVVDGP